MRSVYIAAGLVRRGEELLLVSHPAADAGRTDWLLPSGVAEEQGEVLPALLRAVREQAGLELSAPPAAAAWVTQVTQDDAQVVTLAFETGAWQGELHAGDPAHEPRFFPLARAVELLGTLGYAALRDPALAYLQGQEPPGVVWCYRGSALLAKLRP